MNRIQQLRAINLTVSRQIIAPFFGFKCTHQWYHELPSYSSILKSANDPAILRQLHAHIIISAAAVHDVSLFNNLMNLYASFGLISDAQKIFEGISDKNLFSWTILISGLAKNELFDQAVDSFGRMVARGFLPNEVTISSIMPAFANLGLRILGKSVHCFWVRHGFGTNVVVETSLVDMYSRFGCISIARYLFDKMPVRNLVSWNVIISGYANNGMSNDAMRLFNLMRRDGLSADYFTLMNLISASSDDNWGRTSTAVHGIIIRIGYNTEQQIQTALINMYNSGDLICEAYSVFGEMCCKDVVAWTLMLEGFTSGQYWTKAIEHFNEMTSVTYVVLDSTAIVSSLSSCSSFGALQRGKRIHALVEKQGFSSDVFVGSALINMYANCGDLVDARKCFGIMERKDVACWNAMIRAMGTNGDGEDAIDLLFGMEDLGVNPNESSLVSALSACSHTGMLDEGLQIFCHMVERWKIIPNLQHYGCIVDLLSRSGQLGDANLVISRMPLQPRSGVLGALLSACRFYGNSRMGAQIFQQLIKLDFLDVGHFCSVSNMYASLGNWDGIEMSHVALRSKGMKKDPGCSLIEINQEVCVFMAGEKDHIKYDEFDRLLQGLLLCGEDANFSQISAE